MIGTAAQRILCDAFTRLIEHVEAITAGLTDEAAVYRPTAWANSISWLVWHSARVQDLQLADIAGVEQVWTRDGWNARFALNLDGNDFGYGHRSGDVGRVRAGAKLLAGYYRAVHDFTVGCLAGITDEGLDRVVDTDWDPPVTAGQRLVSIIDDCAQHLGQAAYLRGMLDDG